MDTLNTSRLTFLSVHAGNSLVKLCPASIKWMHILQQRNPGTCLIEDNVQNFPSKNKLFVAQLLLVGCSVYAVFCFFKVTVAEETLLDRGHPLLPMRFQLNF